LEDLWESVSIDDDGERWGDGEKWMLISPEELSTEERTPETELDEK
jgi:hypothetical protein